MDPNTGRLVDTSDLPEEKLAELKTLGYVQVPAELELAARLVLKGKKEAEVSLTSGGKLSKFAARQRKARRKMAKESRKKNRGKQ